MRLSPFVALGEGGIRQSFSFRVCKKMPSTHTLKEKHVLNLTHISLRCLDNVCRWGVGVFGCAHSPLIPFPFTGRCDVSLGFVQREEEEKGTFATEAATAEKEDLIDCFSFLLFSNPTEV